MPYLVNDGFDQNNEMVVPYEGGAMKSEADAAREKQELINSLYKRAADELGITENWWKDQRVANRAYQLLKAYNNGTLTYPNKISPNSTGVKPGEYNPESDVYVEFSKDRSRPGEVVQEGEGLYAEYQRPTTYTLSNMYKAMKDNIAVSVPADQRVEPVYRTRDIQSANTLRPVYVNNPNEDLTWDRRVINTRKSM